MAEYEKSPTPHPNRPAVVRDEKLYWEEMQRGTIL
jgi:hypothetical protein